MRSQTIKIFTFLLGGILSFLTFKGTSQNLIKYTLDCSAGPGNAVIEVTSPVGGSWEYALDGEGFQDNQQFVNLLPGNHQLVVRNDGGERDTIIVNTNCGLEPFPCKSCDGTESFYQVFSNIGRVSKLNLEEGDFQLMPNSPAGYQINAIGINPADSLAYGMKRKTTNELVVVDATGRAINLGPVDNLPVLDFVSGDFGPDGNLQLKKKDLIYKVDVLRGRAAGTYRLPFEVPGADIAYNPTNELFYCVGNDGTCYAFEAESGNVQTIGNTGLSGTIGATYSDQSGKVWCIQNSTGNLYEIDITDANTTFIMQTSSNFFNDGFSCQGVFFQNSPELEIEADCSEKDGKVNLFITRPVGDQYEFSLNESDYRSGRVYENLDPGTQILITRSAGFCNPDTLEFELQPKHQNSKDTAIITCEQFIGPSGEIFSSSTKIIDTLSNVMGCDSIITIDLTILESTESRQTEVVCKEYEWNGKTYRESGTYKYQTINAAGCDSIAILDLEILHTQDTIITVSTCGSYRSPDGEEVWTTSGTYRDTLLTQNNCDSVITVELSAGQVEANFQVADPGCPEPEFSEIEVRFLSHTPPHRMVLGRDTFLLESLPSIVEGVDTGRFELYFVSSDSCKSAPYGIQIDRLVRLQIELFGPSQVHVCDNRVRYSAITDQSGRWEWSPKLWVDCDSCPIIMAEVEASGWIRASLTAENGCRASDSLKVVLEGEEDILLYVPNIFTPNDDGVNDFFTLYAPEGRSGTVEHLEVYDRWGTLLFEARDLLPGIESQGWDGRHFGQPMSPGVYTYRIAYRYCDGTVKELIGTVTLVR